MDKYYPTDLTYYRKGKKQKTCLLIDIAIPGDSNFNAEETEKLRKYRGLGIDIKQNVEIEYINSACYNWSIRDI